MSQTPSNALWIPESKLAVLETAETAEWKKRCHVGYRGELLANGSASADHCIQTKREQMKGRMLRKVSEKKNKETEKEHKNRLLFPLQTEHS
jgi:hypothetical protein